jgi:hypothetical protein
VEQNFLLPLLLKRGFQPVVWEGFLFFLLLQWHAADFSGMVKLPQKNKKLKPLR